MDRGEIQHTASMRRWVSAARLLRQGQSSDYPADALCAGAASTGIGRQIDCRASFLDLSEAKDQEYLTDGLAEELLEFLANLPGLHVIGRTSSFLPQADPPH